MMTRTKKLMLGLSAATVAIGGVACAQAPAGAARDMPGRERPQIDANGDGTVTRAEAQAAATAMFARMDVNRDGKLDQTDRDLGRQQMREKMFGRLDTNSDGSISKAEFMADRGPEDRGAGMNAPPPPGGPSDEGMRGPGMDGPGKEGRRHHGGRGGHGMGRDGHGHRGGGMMAMARDADANKDGAISQAEFMAAATKRFDAEDTNHDGQVTKAEREARHAARKAEWQARKADKMADKKPAN